MENFNSILLSVKVEFELIALFYNILPMSDNIYRQPLLTDLSMHISNYWTGCAEI